MVILRSRALGSVLVAIIAGTVQPKPISSGTMLRPERPIRLKSLSIKNATLAIYPLSSSIDRKKNSITIIGRKLNTLPTPANTPSIISPCRSSLTPTFVRKASAACVTASTPFSRSPCKKAPITLNVSQNTSPIIRINIGIAVYLPVSMRSILRLRICSLLSCGFITVFLHMLDINEKRISAIAALRSSPRSFSSCITMCSSVSCSFSSSSSCSSISLSPSISLLAAKRSGISL